MKTDQKPRGVPSILQPQAKPHGSSRCSRCAARPSPRNWYKTSTFLVQKGGRGCTNSEGHGSQQRHWFIRRGSVASVPTRKKPEFSGIPVFENRQNQRTRRFPPTHNRAVPSTYDKSKSALADFRSFVLSHSFVIRHLPFVIRHRLFHRCLTPNPFLKCAC